MERRRRRRREVTVVAATVALVTALLMVQGVVDAATSNPLRTTHLTLDQYSPLPPYHHGLFGFYETRSNNDGSSDKNNQQQQQQQQKRELQQRQYMVNRKFDDDPIIFRSIDDRYNRRSSIVSIPANDYPIRMRGYDKDSNGGTISRDTLGIKVSQNDKDRSRNIFVRKEFDDNKSNNDYIASPSELDEPFVADEKFKDEGPGSVEIYKLDLLEEEKKILRNSMSNAKGVMMGSFLTGPLAASLAPVTTSVTMRTNNNKSKIPKKSFHLGWKHGKPSSGSFKSTMITTTTSGSNGRDDYYDNNKDDSDSRNSKDRKDLHGGSNFLDSELRSEVPTNVEAFGVGGVPELQVGCEGLEASGITSPFSSSSSSSSTSSSSYPSSPSSRKLKRSVEKTKIEERKVDTPVPLNVVPISLNLDYDLSDESYEEMDELFKLKKLENQPKINKGNRGDIDATLDDILIQDRNVKERLPIRGDLGNWSIPTIKSIKRDKELKVRRDRSTRSENKSGTSGYVSSYKGLSRKLLWQDTDNENRESSLWGYGEDEGVVSSDELDTEIKRRNRVHHRKDEDNKRMIISANNQIDMIREDYEKKLEQHAREQEERLRRFKELESRRSTSSNNYKREEEEMRKLYEDRIRNEEMRRREEARRREDELRRRNLIPEDRRDFDNRRREWLEKKRLEEKEEDERKRKFDEDRRKYEEIERRRLEFSVPSNLLHSYNNRTRNVSNRNEEERNRAREWHRYDNERHRIEMERKRQMLEEEKRRMEEERRRIEIERKRQMLEEERRRMDEERNRMEVERKRQRLEAEERMKIERFRSRENVTRDNFNDREYRRRIIEEQRRLEEERRLQDYVRRIQPVDIRPDELRRRNGWDVSQRLKDEQEQRKAIEIARQMNRSNRYPSGSGHERRQHGPFAPTYVEPRISLDETRRRQEVETMQRRRQQEEEQRRRRLEEERRREIDYRMAESRRYEDERRRTEEIRLEEERKRQQVLEDQRRRSGLPTDRVRTNPVASSPSYLIDRRGIERQARERQRIREEQERRRQEEQNRTRAQSDLDNYKRIMKEQQKRQEEARLNALPVKARIILNPEGSSSYPNINMRSNFDDSIYRTHSRNNNGVKTVKSSSRYTTQTRVVPNPCVWAVVHCCPTNTNRLVTCFESLGCPGVNWDPNPCRRDIEDAAREEVMRYYDSVQEEENRQ